MQERKGNHSQAFLVFRFLKHIPNRIFVRYGRDSITRVNTAFSKRIPLVYLGVLVLTIAFPLPFSSAVHIYPEVLALPQSILLVDPFSKCLWKIWRSEQRAKDYFRQSYDCFSRVRHEN